MVLHKTCFEREMPQVITFCFSALKSDSVHETLSDEFCSSCDKTEIIVHGAEIVKNELLFQEAVAIHLGFLKVLIF